MWTLIQWVCERPESFDKLPGGADGAGRRVTLSSKGIENIWLDSSGKEGKKNRKSKKGPDSRLRSLNCHSLVGKVQPLKVFGS